MPACPGTRGTRRSHPRAAHTAAATAPTSRRSPTDPTCNDRGWCLESGACLVQGGMFRAEASTDLTALPAQEIQERRIVGVDAGAVSWACDRISKDSRQRQALTDR